MSFVENLTSKIGQKTHLSGIAYVPLRAAYVPLMCRLVRRLGSPHRKAYKPFVFCHRFHTTPTPQMPPKAARTAWER